MTITVYKISDDRRVVNKTLGTAVATLTAVFKNDADILYPVLEVAYNSSVLTANYLYIDTLHRYYYIKNIKLDRQRLFLECEVDVLKTYYDGIRNLTCVVSRQSNINKAQNYLNDDFFRLLQYNEYLQLYFTKGGSIQEFSDYSYVLAAAGETYPVTPGGGGNNG